MATFVVETKSGGTHTFKVASIDSVNDFVKLMNEGKYWHVIEWIEDDNSIQGFNFDHAISVYLLEEPPDAVESS